jgi:hypothetical protein
VKQANIHKIRDNEVVRKRLAKLMALRCFRNTCLEDLHAGRVPHAQTGDYTDVRVVDSEREIPWVELSRLSDREMETLMIEVVDHCYDFLTMLYGSAAADEVIAELTLHDPLPEWHDPVGWKARKRRYEQDVKTDAGP